MLATVIVGIAFGVSIAGHVIISMSRHDTTFQLYVVAGCAVFLAIFFVLALGGSCGYPWE